MRCAQIKSPAKKGLYMNEIRVKDTIWKIGLENRSSFDKDADVYHSDDYPDLVLIIFDRSKGYKYDWYKHIDLIRGESTYENSYVLILEKLIELHDIPRWYKALDDISSIGLYHQILRPYIDVIELETIKNMGADYGNIERVVEIYEYVLSNAKKIDMDMKYWIEQLLSFFERYGHTNREMDLSSHNIMTDGSRYILTDPIG